MGFPPYKVLDGKIIFKGKDIDKKKIEDRVKSGIVLAFQNPPAVNGITLSQLLKRISKGRNEIISEDILNRELNVNFSGGEKKISELMQVFALKPKLLILDEIDSGLDIRKRQEMFKLISEMVKKDKMSVLIITHQGEILEYLKPDIVNVVINGKTMCRGKDSKKILETIKKYGYVKCKNCKKL
jgi:Fe-S cluster assembly ATP-binding protein